MAVVTIETGQAGRDYAVDTLRGCPGLAASLVELAERRDWQALVPAGTTTDRLEQFEAGGLCRSNVGAAALFEAVCAKLSPGSVLVCQDIWMDRGSLLKGGATPGDVFGADDAVYQVVRGADLTLQSFEDCLLVMTSFKFLVALGREGESVLLGQDRISISFDHVADLELLALPAYDGESFVISALGGNDY